MKTSFTTLVLVAIYLAVAKSDTRVDFVLSARDLPNMDIFDGAPDPYVMVFYASRSNESYTKVAQTPYISDENNPDWPDVFSFNLTGAFSQQKRIRGDLLILEEHNISICNMLQSLIKIQIDIYDSDYDADDYIGSAEFRLRDIVDSFGHQLSRDLVPGGNGRLLVSGLVNGTRSSGAKFDARLINPSKVVPIVSSNGVSHKERVQSPKFFKL